MANSQIKITLNKNPNDYDELTGEDAVNNALRELADLHERENPNKRPDLPRNELQPKLYINRCPFEHRVVAYNNLHPRIKAYIDLIRKMTVDSRVVTSTIGLIFLGQFVPSLNANWATSIAPAIIPNFLYWIHQRDKFRGKEGHNISLKCLLVSGFNPNKIADLEKDVHDSQQVHFFSIPYKFPNKHTDQMSKLIKAIVSQRESPFNEIDCVALVREYHYGVIDNDGNMVLIKDPRDKSSKSQSKIKTWFKTKQLKQPFQREMFEISKPDIKVEQEESASVQAALPDAI
jgi:hypothetical protein